MNSRIKIQQTINKLNEVSEEKITIAQIAADQFIEDAQQELDYGKFARAQIYAEQARSLAPDYNSVILLLGKIKLFQYKIIEAQNYFKQIQKNDYNQIKAKLISEREHKEKLSA